jgi:small-conductance mechanosensitive channel
VDYLPNVFFIVVIAFLTRYVLKFVHLFFDAIREGTVEFPGFYREWAEPSYKIVRFMILAFVVVVVFPYLPGAGSDAFQGVSIFLGALFTLGSSSAIANIVAGVVLTFTRAFQVGDRVKIGDTTGDVMEKSLLVTRVRTIKNVDITVPNAIVMSSHIINYSARADESGVILHTGVTIGYDVPWRQVHALLLEAAASTEGVRREPKAFVLQTSLDDFYVSYQLNAYSANPKAMARTYSDLHQNIQDAFNKAGVEILSPHYRAARDGNEITIPPDQRPAGYTAPGFRVQQLRPDGDG